MTDANNLFMRAQRAFAAGDATKARRDLSMLRALIGDHPAALHLLALVEKKAGNAEAARAAFAAASKLAPDNPHIIGNHANLLADLGEPDAALRLYDEAIAIDPGFKDAVFNRALLLQKLGRLQEAVQDLDALSAAGPADARVHSARGSILRQLGQLHQSAAAFDEALRLDPGRLIALHGRARVAMERGEDQASGFYTRALQHRPGDLELVLGLTESLEAEGDPLGLELLKEAVDRHPSWIEGHRVLARMRSEAGEGEDFAGHYKASLAKDPRNRALHVAYWQDLARGERFAEAIAAINDAEPYVAADSQTRLMQAMFMADAGDPGDALALLQKSGLGGPGVDFARGRIALQMGRPDEAAEALNRVVVGDPGSISGWAHLDLAWRLTGDQRHQWLSGQPGLFGARDLGLSIADIAGLAELLRSLHKIHAHPIGQSLRGGTQTRGRLFSRQEPELAALHDALTEAVRLHIDGLPPLDETHPLLRHRNAKLRIEGSWSVRLHSQGFHVSHIHPEGVLSSACYISLPEGIGTEEDREGWLEIGRPPAALALPLEPITVVRPHPGRLALFPSYLFHGTRPFHGGERLTVAFDVTTA